MFLCGLVFAFCFVFSTHQDASDIIRASSTELTAIPPRLLDRLLVAQPPERPALPLLPTPLLPADLPLWLLLLLLLILLLLVLLLLPLLLLLVVCPIVLFKPPITGLLVLPLWLLLFCEWTTRWLLMESNTEPTMTPFARPLPSTYACALASTERACPSDLK